MTNIGIKIANGNKKYKALINLLIHVLTMLRKTYDQMIYLFEKIIILTSYQK